MLKEKEREAIYSQPLDLKEDLDTVSPLVPYVENVVDEDLQEDFGDLYNPENVDEKGKVAYELNLMIELLQAESGEEVAQIVDSRHSEINDAMRENQKKILENINSYEKMLRAVNLFFENAGSGEVEGAYFMTVDPNKFAGADNSIHYQEFCEYLKKKFYALRLKESPLFLAHVGDIGSGADQMAAIANETVAIAIVDMPETKSVKAALKKASTRNLNGIEAEWGNLVASGTWLTARKSYKGVEEKDFQVPSAAAILGKLMNTKEGNSIAGFENGGLKGTKGVAYPADRRDSDKFIEQGLMIIMEDGGKVLPYSDRTANMSENDDLRKVSKMVVRNRIMKDLVDFCNLKAFAKWGYNEKKAFHNSVIDYLNKCKKKGWIQSVKNVKVKDVGNDEVAVLVELVFFDARSKYLINIKGKPGEYGVDSVEKLI